MKTSRPRGVPGPTIMVAVACNDHRSGLFDSRAGGVHFGDEAEWEPPTIDGPVFRVNRGRFRLGLAAFSFVASKEWIGNWCWNGYWMTTLEAVKLARWLVKSGWTCVMTVEGSPFGDKLPRHGKGGE